MNSHIQLPKVRTNSNIKNVAIFGSADVDEKHPLYQEVFKMARYLAYHDKVVVNGGGPGVMLAATEGAKSAGGKTLAVTFYPKDMPEFEGRMTENVVDVEIKTATYIERLFELICHSDVFIIVQGGTGTLSEWATAWLLGHLYYGKHKPMILYGEFWHEVMRVINENFFIGEKEQQIYRIVKDEVELIAAMDELEIELKTRHLLPVHASGE